MHSTVPDSFSFQEMAPKEAQSDPFGMGQSYGGEVGKPTNNKRPTIAERHAAEFKQQENRR